MQTTRVFNKKPLVLGIGLAMAASIPAVQAQEQLPLEEVIVTASYRQSLINSIDSKRDAPQVIEAIAAEDIGKLPDSSIADSIARIPGLAAQRLDGRSSSISIRGLGENFSASTLNGREQVSLSDNRGVEFDLYPSEIMSGVVVYKTADASLTTQGVAGVIDLQTVKPLDYDERVIQINTLFDKNDIGALNPDGEDTGQRITFSYIDQFMDETLGVAFAYNTMESPNNEERWNAWGYPETDEGNYILGGAKPFVRSSMLERDTYSGVVQYEPNDALRMTADAMFIDFSDEKTLRGIEIPGWWGSGGVTQNSVVDGFVDQGVFNNRKVQVRNDFEKREAEMKAYGFNLEYDLTDSLTLEFDVGHSDVDRKVWSLESYSGTGRGDANGITDNIGFNQVNQEGTKFQPEINYADYSLIQLGGALNWGNGATVPSDAQDGFINIPEISDDLDTLRLVATQSFDDGILAAVEGGVYYSDRIKKKTDTGIFLTLKDYPNTMAVPEQYRRGTVSLDFIGMGDMIAYDSFGLWQDGFYKETQEGLTVGSRSVNDWSVKEEITIGYVKADFETQLGGIEMTGNAGLQVVHTDQSSKGKAVQIIDGLVKVVDTSAGDTYVEYLPSMNLTFHLTEEQQLRFAASRTMSRSRMDRMNAGFSYGFDEAQNVAGGAPFTASGGNPELQPNMANQYDVSYEWYFTDAGYISAAAYYKDLRSWQVQKDVPFDMADLVDVSTLPGADKIRSTQGLSNVWVNSDGGDITGFEFTTAVPGEALHESLMGFGVVVSASFIDSSLETGSGDEIPVPGLSDRIYNFTLYYEKNGLQLRTSMRKRSDFQGERFGTSFTRESATVVGSELWDAQASFDFGEAGIEALDGLVVTLQGQNLTDEPFVTLDGNDFVKDYQVFGRTYLLGASYKF